MTIASDRALVIAAHGSHLNADSASAAFNHLIALRQLPEARELFGELVPAFWKEEPELKDVLASLTSREVVVVPLFISEGYFTTQVIPRELGVRGRAPCHELVGGRWVHYTEPIGTHPVMREVVRHAAERIMKSEGTLVPLARVALVLAGHGTARNPTSAQATTRMAEAMRSEGIFAEVSVAFLEEPPFVSQALDAVRASEVIVVPYFMAEGLHTQDDLPTYLGIVDAHGRYTNPTMVHGRRVWYAPAVGTDGRIPAVILARAREALGTPPPQVLPDPPAREARRAWLAWLNERLAAQDSVTIGQLTIYQGASGWLLTHTDDRLDEPRLVEYREAADAYALTRFTEHERHRPLRSAPTLIAGWRLGPLTNDGLCQALDAFYPAGVIAWHQARGGTLPVVDWAETVGRQTGLFADVAQTSPAQLASLVQSVCARSCLKTPRWHPAADLVTRRGDDAAALVCREACSWLIAQAREAVTPSAE